MTSVYALHRLLIRQIKKITGGSLKIAAADIDKLLSIVSHAYEEYDQSQKRSDRATKLMSEELLELNNKIQEEARHNLEQSEQKYYQDVTLKKEWEDSLRIAVDEATKKLVESNIELERFAYICSHDLQEPLRVITMYTQLLMKNMENSMDEKSRHYAQYITESAANARALISSILTYARIGTEPERTEAVECEAVLSMVMANLEISIKDAGVIVTYDNLPVVQAHKMQIAQLIQNLLSNAIKFHSTDLQPVVNITASRQGDFWEFSISDNGIGIDEKYQQKIFDIFQRLNKRNEYPGTGIGLAIAKKIVEFYQGRIWVESAPGVGTTFFFTLPAVQ